MASPEHRRGRGSWIDPRWGLLLAFVLGLLVAGGVAGVVALMSDEPVGGQEQRPEGSRPSQEAGDARSPRALGQPSSGQPSSGRASPDAAEQRALMTEPLSQLQEGDRVVYNMAVCRFRGWVGDGVDVALVACPGEPPFQARTETLVPVEAARGD